MIDVATNGGYRGFDLCQVARSVRFERHVHVAIESKGNVTIISIRKNIIIGNISILSHRLRMTRQLVVVSVVSCPINTTNRI